MLAALAGLGLALGVVAYVLGAMLGVAVFLGVCLMRESAQEARKAAAQDSAAPLSKRITSS